MVGAAVGMVLPLIIFIGGTIIVLNLFEKHTLPAVITTFLLTYYLAESKLGRGVWEWLAGLGAAAFGHHAIHA
jgi:hypothetical protein